MPSQQANKVTPTKVIPPPPRRSFCPLKCCCVLPASPIPVYQDRSIKAEGTISNVNTGNVTMCVIL